MCASVDPNWICQNKLIQTSIFFLYLIEGLGSIIKSPTFELGLTKKSFRRRFHCSQCFGIEAFHPRGQRPRKLAYQHGGRDVTSDFKL